MGNEQKARKRGYYFREWREHRGLTQQQLAAIMDVSVATVSRIESGQRAFTQDWLEDFVTVCSMPSPGTVLDRPPKVKLDGEPAERLKPEQVARIERKLVNIRAKDVRKAVRKQVEKRGHGLNPGPKKSALAKSA